MKQMELWVVNTRALGLSPHLNELLGLLPDDDRSKALRYRLPADRLRCAVGRVLIRSLAAETVGNYKAPLCFTEYGKPYFSDRSAPRFSLSHSGELVVLAVSDGPVGVDVEEIRPIDLGDFDTVLTDAEKSAVRASGNALTEFYRIWTAREAYSKLDGRGVGLFEGCFQWERSKRGCDFRTFESDAHVLTLCADHIPPELVPDVFSQSKWKTVLAKLEEHVI